jgi:hypothetical protein
MADYNMNKELEMWKNTSYPAQMDMLKEAGLNPALMYGMGGGGGVTTGSPSTNVSSGEAPKGGGEAMGMGIEMMNLQLMKAQKENIEADTKNKEADIPVKQAQTSSLQQGVESAKAQQVLTQVQTELEKIKVQHDQRTLNDSIDTIHQQLKILRNDASLSDETYSAKLDIIMNEAIGVVLRNDLTTAQTNQAFKDIDLKDAQINEIANKIQQAWKGLDQNDTKLAIEKFKSEIEANYPGVLGVLGRISDDAINTLYRISGLDRQKLQFKKVDKK